MTTPLHLPIEKLRGVGSRNVGRLHKLGIKTVKDLLWHFPARYEDYTETVPISKIEPGQKVNIRGEVIKISTRRIFPRRMTVTNAIVGDETGAVKVAWFNQPYIENHLSEGTKVSLAGKVNLGKQGVYLSSPTYEKIVHHEAQSAKQETEIPNSDLKHTSGLVPIYPETEGVTSKYLRFLIKPLLKENLGIVDPMPESILQKHNFLSLAQALKVIHCPEKIELAETAKERFAFDDLLLFQIRALFERRKINQLKSIAISFDKNLIQNFILSLPFELTSDQKIAAWEILKDVQKNYPMNRLLEGDVGSGKTIVALIAAYQIAARGHQVVFMVPTEVLAQQHYATITSLLKNLKSRTSNPGHGRISTGLLIANEAKLDNEPIVKKLLKEKISSGEVGIIIGTQAIIQKDVLFDKLALVVIDEQHRFGINQRKALLAGSKTKINDPEINNTKPGINGETVPHLLSMTATPIPRTLALTIYGDLDISLIKEKPKNRQKIITRISMPTQKNEAYGFIRKEISGGRQAFIICPRIEISDPKKEIRTTGAQSKMNILWSDVKAVEEEYEKLSRQIFPDLRIAMLHGRLKTKDKNEIMDKFKNREYDILVSTSVVEVGVDVPNATVMAIESAERFGLAQLHQFRGRVGRSEHQSYCLLFSSTGDRAVNKRLKALVECDDGFELAEKDMRIRGPGEFFGVKQSGMPDLGMASLADINLIKKARFEARVLLKEDSSLKKYPLLQDRLESFQKLTHFE